MSREQWSTQKTALKSAVDRVVRIQPGNEDHKHRLLHAVYDWIVFASSAGMSDDAILELIWPLKDQDPWEAIPGYRHPTIERHAAIRMLGRFSELLESSMDV